ncbi:MAG: hypothetical protein HZB16_22125, partial [Armatimonadetes bacterium]|nr:hypothetical protein [Armatimonadota bacterium]
MNGEVRDWGTMRRVGPALVIIALLYSVPLAMVASRQPQGAAPEVWIVAALVLLTVLLPAVPSWLSMGRFAWDDVGLRRTALRRGWSLAWSDLVDCGVKPDRLGAPAFVLTTRDGSTRTAALSGVSPKDRRLFDELMRRTASLRARHEAALDARDLEILPSAEAAKMMRDLRRVALVIAAIGL